MKKFNIKKLNKNQIYTLISATLFLIGAVFMLVYTFGDQAWAVWTGLAIALLAVGVYVLLVIEQRRTVSKNFSETKKNEPETTEKSETEVPTTDKA